MNRRSALAVAAVLVLAGCVPAAGAGAGTDSLNQVPGSDVTADNIEMRATVDADGDANWTVTYRIRLADENETAAFESLQEDIRANASRYVAPFATGINATVAAAENRTGRKMTAGGFGVTTDTEYVPREYGVVTYQFTWGGFAAVDGDRLRAGDALTGLFLDSATRLTVAAPSYAPLEVAPRDPAEVRSESVVWAGPLDFAPGEPTLVFGPPDAAGADSDPTTAGDSGGDLPLGEVLFAALVAAFLAATLVLLGYRRFGGTDAPAGAGTEPGRDLEATTSGSDEETADSGLEPGGGDSGNVADDELLSNEEHVERLLEERGGRVKQQEIVSGLDWTEAKTSQVVNAMQDAGRIEKFRIGRENVVKLPDEDDESE